MPDQQRHTHPSSKNPPRQQRVQRVYSSLFRSSAQRRDARQPRVINSREVRFPEGIGGIPRDRRGDLHITLGTSMDPSGQVVHERSLREDMAFDPKLRRAHLQQKRRRRQRIVAGIVALCLVAIFSVGLLWMQRSNNLADAVTQHLAAQKPAAYASSAATATAATATATASTEPTGAPTPITVSAR